MTLGKTEQTMTADNTRIETDSMGPVDVPADRYWGAQTERARHHFAIGRDPFPLEIIHALAEIKRAAALANAQIGVLDQKRADLIVTAAEEVVGGRHDREFPLHVWMTGSGTQANMNVNEVIANRAIELSGGRIGSKDPVHPNDHVNRSQSTNDAFPAAIHIAAAAGIQHRLLPEVQKLSEAFATKSEAWRDIVKIGRTHLQDAVPLTLGQEASAWRDQLSSARDRIETSLQELYPLPLGGTAVGTGLNAPEGFAAQAATELARLSGLPLTSTMVRRNPERAAPKLRANPSWRVWRARIWSLETRSGRLKS